MPAFIESRERLINDVKTMLADTEDLLEAVGTESKEKIEGVRPRLEAAILRARGRVTELEAQVEARARQAARDADAYAHENPWKTAGVAAALGAIIGVLLARR